jgi:predicted TIM-barrel fold metal-dependent hydrolase
MRIVDAQVHIWASGKPTNPNHRQVERFTKDDLLKENIHDHLKRIFDAFGPARMFWGTDITRMPCSWRQCVTMFTEELPWLSGRDRDLVMGGAVCAWLEWKQPA